MEEKSKRRNFLKYLFSLSAFIAGSNFLPNMVKGLKCGKSSVPDAWGKESVNKNVKKIAVEEHAIKQDLELLDKRLKDMDEAGIDMQVFSYDVGNTESLSRSEDLDTAKSANETLSKIVEKYPDRFACYCTLPMRNPDAAPDEPGSNLTKKPSEYFLSNFYVTTSGMCWQPVFQFVLSVMGADKILFACDYPPEPALDSSKFIDAAPMSVSDREKVCHLNAKKLFSL